MLQKIVSSKSFYLKQIVEVNFQKFIYKVNYFRINTLITLKHLNYTLTYPYPTIREVLSCASKIIEVPQIYVKKIIFFTLAWSLGSLCAVVIRCHTFYWPVIYQTIMFRHIFVYSYFSTTYIATQYYTKLNLKY